MSPWAVAAFACVTLTAGSALGQVRDVRPAAGTGTIRGVVVSDDLDARPVRKARVTCGGADVPGRTTITDAEGRFEFAGLPAGRYTVGASKATWVPASYGAKRPARPGTPVPVGAGQALDIVVRLPRGAVITGVLLDHDNQPASGALVRAMRYQMSGGERRLVPAADATADDRGTYRIYGLAAGDYFVSATVRGLGGMSAGDLRLANRMVAFAPAYFPNGTSVSQAATISLRPGEERTGVDFALQLVPTARVEGIVSLAEGGVPAATEINLIAAGASATPGLPFEGYRPGRPAADGTFSFSGVPPGTYTLLARATRPITNPDGSAAPAQTLWASTQIAVDGEHVTGLALSLEPGLTIAGVARFAASGLAAPDPTTIRISAVPFEPQGAVSFAPPAAAAGADGRFTIAGVIPGRYRLAATFPGLGRSGGWVVHSIAANAQDALDAPLTVVANQHVLDAMVTFTERLAQISGTVRATTPADYTVVLFPEDQRAWLPQSRRIQGTRPAADGAYSLRNVPAGRYLVALAEDAEPGEWFDPAFLQRLMPAAARVTVGDAEPVALDLRPGGSR